MFTDTPTAPYDLGDLWVNDNGHGFNELNLPIYGDLFVCVVAKEAGEEYDPEDFCKAIKYTDDTTVNTHMADSNSHVTESLKEAIVNARNHINNVHIEDEEEVPLIDPHNVTAEQVNAYTKSQVDSALAGKKNNSAPGIVANGSQPSASAYGRNSFVKGDIWVKI